MPGLWSCSVTKRSISPRYAAKLSPPCACSLRATRSMRLDVVGALVDREDLGVAAGTARRDGPARSRRRRRSGWPARRRGTPGRRSTPSRSASGGRPGPGGRRPWPGRPSRGRCARSAWRASLTASVRMPSTLAFISSSMRRTSECSMIGDARRVRVLEVPDRRALLAARARRRARSGTPSTRPRCPARRPRCARRSSCGTSA